jgi:uncharacterized membrane protein YhhN
MGRTVRMLVAASLLFGLGYPLLWAQPLAPGAMIAAKGAGVGMLALAAALRARTADAWRLAALLAFGALGDVLIEIELGAGAFAFAMGHVAAISLYARNRRSGLGLGDLLVAVGLLGFAAAAPFLLLRGRPEQIAFTAYALLLGAMAASAWLSRFPRGLVALGALLFVASDILIAARLGMGARPFGLGLAIWLLYYCGQFLIFVGVSSSLAAERTGRGTMRSMVEG